MTESISSSPMRGGQVDGDEVAVLDGALDADEGAEALAQRGEPLLDVVVGRL